jgi:hypothetical protein
MEQLPALYSLANFSLLCIFVFQTWRSITSVQGNGPGSMRCRGSVKPTPAGLYYFQSACYGTYFFVFFNFNRCSSFYACADYKIVAEK